MLRQSAAAKPSGTLSRDPRSSTLPEDGAASSALVTPRNMARSWRFRGFMRDPGLINALQSKHVTRKLKETPIESFSLSRLLLFYATVFRFRETVRDSKPIVRLYLASSSTRGSARTRPTLLTCTLNCCRSVLTRRRAWGAPRQI